MNTDALDIARQLSPLILRMREQTETQRRLAEPIVERMRDSGLCRMAVPRQLQGLETPLGDILDVYETLAYVEGSAAWIVWNNALPCLLGRFLPAVARAEVFGDPHWLYAGSTRPTGRAAIEGDDYRVDGRWSLVSGCELAEWLLLLCVVEENGEPRMVAPGIPEVRFVFVRRGDWEVLDTWHTDGLRGTGSHDVVVTDRHVPHARTLAPGAIDPHGSPHDRLPIICTMAAGYGALLLGAGQRAVDTIVALTKTKVAPDSGQALREHPAVLEAIVHHGTALAAARAYLRLRTNELWERILAEEPATLDSISALWAAGHHAAEAGRNAVDAMYEAGGTTSIYTDCPLERAHRDVHAMLRHIVVQPFWLEDAGRVQLGIAPTHPLYAV